MSKKEKNRSQDRPHRADEQRRDRSAYSKSGTRPAGEGEKKERSETEVPSPSETGRGGANDEGGRAIPGSPAGAPTQGTMPTQRTSAAGPAEVLEDAADEEIARKEDDARRVGSMNLAVGSSEDQADDERAEGRTGKWPEPGPTRVDRRGEER